jgi:hypothetical protein
VRERERERERERRKGESQIPQISSSNLISAESESHRKKI